ncbi:hypothetical protein HanOQP8_Chr02g0054881 [Helianthus annuus]|nr:hypothetical protein HanOQP8_Chr02g0054881 [Helianthus annuus]
MGSNSKSIGLQKPAVDGLDLHKESAGRRESGPSDEGIGQMMGLALAPGPSVLKQQSGPSKLEPVLQPIMDSIIKAQKTYGSGFYDVSKNDFGSNLGPMCKTKNNFGTLINEEECFDTDIGLWEYEIEKVKKLVETSTRPKLEEYCSWSENMRKYYDGLTKMNEDEEVASETDEMACFMKSGVKS